MTTYEIFLAQKKARVPAAGLQITDVHPMLFDWQAELVRWAGEVGRAAIWADTGLGKTLMQVEWARHMADGMRALIVAPLAEPVWWDIKETNTLNVRVAREEADERHICPLQLDFIERCVRLWSNPGETVFTPFAGIGSEVYVARQFDRYGLGIELKPSYWNTAVENLTRLESEMNRPSLLD